MAQCYEFNYKTNQPQPLPDVWIQCPTGDNCCIGIDLCLSNNICHYVPHSNDKREASYSSYYNARCTDPTYTNPACDKICIDSPPDLVYNYTSSLWACCGGNTAGEVTCNDPLEEYYEAPAPNDLATLSRGASVASTATLTPYAQASSTATRSIDSGTTSVFPTSSTSASARTNSSGLSIGAEAGIGVAVVICTIVSLAALLFWIRRNKARRRSRKAREMEDHQPKSSENNYPVAEMPGYGIERQELDANESDTLIELTENGSLPSSRKYDSQTARLELPALM